MAFTNDMLMNGDDLFLYIVTGSGASSAFTPIAFATSCSIQVDGESIDASSKMSGRWNDSLAGKNSYTISSDALYTKSSGATSFDTLLAKMVASHPDNQVTWAMAPATDRSAFAIKKADCVAHGKGVITSLSLEAGNNEIATCSITITGAGAIDTTALS